MSKIDWMSDTDIKDAMKDGIKNAKTAFEYGVSNPRRNPIEAAIAAINAGIWEKNFKVGIDKWVAKLQAITLDEWKTVTKAAASRYAEEASKMGAENWSKYYEKAKSVIEAAASELIKSPQGKEDFVKFYESMSKLKYL